MLKAKKVLGNRIQIYTRHPSYDNLKKLLPRLNFKVVARFGSTTDVSHSVSNGGKTIEINEVSGVRNSASKLLMKKCFDEAGISHAIWFRNTPEGLRENNGNIVDETKLPYPLIIKSFTGSRGVGNYYIENHEEFVKFKSSHDLNNYIIEKYYTYLKEYRIHVTRDG